MRIRADSTICGLPVLQLRDGLRRIARVRSSGIEYLSRCFRLSLPRTRKLVKDLITQGLLEPDETGPGKDKRYRITLAGGTLSLATAAPPISRATAERKLSEFLDRVKGVNRDDHYLYRVRRVVVFGSYLSEAPAINDIDLAVELVHRIAGHEARYAAAMRRVAEAEKAGRQFSSTFEQLTWPHTEVLRVLKSKSRAISLHDIDDAVLKSALSREIFRDEGGIDDANPGRPTVL